MEPDKPDKIIRIDRKKSVPFKNRVIDQYNKFLINLTERHYKDQKLLWRVIYDKLYRIELFDYVMNCEDKNINIARNIFNINEEKYVYKQLNEDLILDDNLFVENLFLLNYHKYYKFEKIAFLCFIPTILLFPIGLYKRSKRLLFGFTFILLFNLLLNGYIHNKKTNLGKSKVDKELKKKYKYEVKRYRMFFYDT